MCKQAHRARWKMIAGSGQPCQLIASSIPAMFHCAHWWKTAVSFSPTWPCLFISGVSISYVFSPAAVAGSTVVWLYESRQGSSTKRVRGEFFTLFCLWKWSLNQDLLSALCCHFLIQFPWRKLIWWPPKTYQTHTARCWQSILVQKWIFPHQLASKASGGRPENKRGS